VREAAAGKLHLAYLRDPDGNRLCACTEWGNSSPFVIELLD
jgi:hypothetical protein